MYGRNHTVGPVGRDRVGNCWLSCCPGVLFRLRPALASLGLLFCLAWSGLVSGQTVISGWHNSAASGAGVVTRAVTYKSATATSVVIWEYDPGVGYARSITATQAGATISAVSVAQGAWTGLTSTSGDRDCSFTNLTPNVSWGMTQATYTTNKVDFSGGSWQAKVSFLSGVQTVQIYAAAPIIVTVSADGTFTVFDPAAPQRGELMMLLNNLSGVAKDIYFGTKLLHLSPGMNQLRYDGELQDGFPKVAPSDFSGVLLTGPDGTKYLEANLVPSGLDAGEVMWQAPPPTAPTEPPVSGRDSIEVINPGNATQGPTIAIHHPNGATTLTTLPKTPLPTSSNTTGSGGVISDPTQPKPSQSTTNTTTTNTTNNTTNNVTNNNTSVFGGTSTGDGPGVDTGGPVTDTAEKGRTASILPTGWDTVTELPGGALQVGEKLQGSATSFEAKLNAFHPFAGLVAGGGGDLTNVTFSLGGGRVANVVLPLQAPGIGIFRACCLFAVYWRYICRVMHILKV